ncbi:MAG: hypothetical protein HYU30_02500 [Chloroflexi bacterium]|nr:hypothetical protein [Chloroflexota bacterium]
MYVQEEAGGSCQALPHAAHYLCGRPNPRFLGLCLSPVALYPFRYCRAYIHADGNVRAADAHAVTHADGNTRAADAHAVTHADGNARAAYTDADAHAVTHADSNAHAAHGNADGDGDTAADDASRGHPGVRAA